MTEQIKSVIEYLENVIEIVHRSNPDVESPEVKMAIRSLQAWEEVLQGLEEENIFWTKQAFKHKDDEFAEGKTFGLSKAIDIIKQKLAEIEE